MRIIHVVGPAVGRPQNLHAAGPPVASARRHPAAPAAVPGADRDRVSSSSLRSASVELSPQAIDAARHAAEEGADRAAPDSFQAVQAPVQSDVGSDVPARPWPTAGLGGPSSGAAPDDGPAPDAEPHEPVSESAAVNAAAISYELRADGYLYAVARSADQSHPHADAPGDDASADQGDDRRTVASAAASARGRQVFARLKAGRA